MVMEDEAEDYEHYQHIHFEVKLQIDDIRQDYEVYDFVLELVCYFLTKASCTMTSPSIMVRKNTREKKQYSKIARVSIML